MKIKFMLKVLTLIILLLIGSLAKAQVEIARQSFTSANASVTSPSTFSQTANACGSSFLDCFDYKSCYTGGLADGGDEMHFYAFDQDGRTTINNPYVEVDLGTIAAGNVGDIVFYGLFGANGSFDAADSAIVSISLNGGAYTKYLKVSLSGTDLVISNGVTSNTLSSTLVKRSVSLGSGLNGQSVNVRINIYGINANDEGFGFDEFSLTHTPPPCTISDLVAGTQSTCYKPNNTYTQEVTVTYSGSPTGNLVVAGQSFTITGSPQTVTLTGLISDGSAVDVTAEFTSSTCPYTENALFTAPADCSCTTADPGTISK